MAQAIALPNDIRHGFVQNSTFNPSSDNIVGRITAISVTKQNNILMCDNQKNQLILFDKNGGYLQHLPLDCSPWDIAISDDNVAYVTIPSKKTILQVDPDKLGISSTFVSMDPDINISCVSYGGSALEGFDMLRIRNVSQNHIYLGYNSYGGSYYTKLSNGNITGAHFKNPTELGSKMAVKYHVYMYTKGRPYIHFHCATGQNYVGRRQGTHGKESFTTSPTLLGPSDICSDDNGHIYVSGQYSHNIYRLDEDGKVVDIPLSNHHGIKYPVALCFNLDFTKLYIVNNWGQEVQIYNVL